jgi:hypothetical protein
MTIPANNANSSSSSSSSSSLPTPTDELSDALSAFDNLAPLELVLSYIKEGIRSGANGERAIKNRGPRRYLIGNEDDEDDDDSNSSVDETGFFYLILIIIFYA